MFVAARPCPTSSPIMPFHHHRWPDALVDRGQRFEIGGMPTADGTEVRSGERIDVFGRVPARHEP
jgi:hypothetical protein